MGRSIIENNPTINFLKSSKNAKINGERIKNIIKVIMLNIFQQI